jgi:protein TonB
MEGPGEAPAQARGRYLERHYAYIRDAIQQGISYPPMARKMGWEGKVVVAFLVLADGSVRDVRIVRGSGHPALDRGAFEAVRKAAPFPRPPAEAEIITPVVYRLE